MGRTTWSSALAAKAIAVSRCLPPVKEETLRVYLILALLLSLLWITWLVIPLPAAYNGLGAGKLLGFIAVELLFLLLGSGGLVLCLRGVIGYELALVVFLHPVFMVIALASPPPFDGALYVFPFLLLAFFGWLAWIDS